MKSRRMTIVSCLCALAATAAGAAYFTSAHTPIQMPARDTGTSGSSSGSQPDASRETASRQLLNAMPSASGSSGNWYTVTLDDPTLQSLEFKASDMEHRKPLPPANLSPDQNTDSTNQLANSNRKPSAGNSDVSSENEEGGGLPPTTDKPVVDGGSETSSAPESGNSGEGQPSEPEPEPSEPSGEEPSSREDQNSESGDENSAQESSSVQSEEGTDSSEAPPQSEASSSDEQAEGTSTQESQQ